MTYENGTHYNNQCNNKSRSASILFICGQNTVREKSCLLINENL